MFGFHQDFADIVSQPSLEGPASSDLEVEEEQNAGEESSGSALLSSAFVKTLVEVHQRLCLDYAQSLWYKGAAPVNHTKEAIKAVVTSYQIAAPVMSRFYHLLGWFLTAEYLMERYV